MHNHFRDIKGYDPVVKAKEVLNLQVFATNALRIAAEKKIPLSSIFKREGISTSMLYDMRSCKYNSFVNFYKLIRIACYLGEDLITLLKPTQDYFNPNGITPVNNDFNPLECLKMNQTEYAAFRGVSRQTVHSSIQTALKKNILPCSSLPCVVSIERYGVKGYVLYVKI